MDMHNVEQAKAIYRPSKAYGLIAQPLASWQEH